MAASPAADGGGVDAGDCLDILDENVALLRQCIKRGVPVVPTEDGKSFTLGDVLLPKDTLCVCPWGQTKTPKKLPRYTLATLVFMVQQPPGIPSAQYVADSQRAGVPHLPPYSWRCAKTFFGIESSTTRSLSPTSRNPGFSRFGRNRSLSAPRTTSPSSTPPGTRRNIIPTSPHGLSGRRLNLAGPSQERRSEDVGVGDAETQISSSPVTGALDCPATPPSKCTMSSARGGIDTGSSGSDTFSLPGTNMVSGACAIGGGAIQAGSIGTAGEAGDGSSGGGSSGGGISDGVRSYGRVPAVIVSGDGVDVVENVAACSVEEAEDDNLYDRDRQREDSMSRTGGRNVGRDDNALVTRADSPEAGTSCTSGGDFVDRKEDHRSSAFRKGNNSAEEGRESKSLEMTQGEVQSGSAGGSGDGGCGGRAFDNNSSGSSDLAGEVLAGLLASSPASACCSSPVERSSPAVAAVAVAAVTAVEVMPESATMGSLSSEACPQTPSEATGSIGATTHTLMSAEARVEAVITAAAPTATVPVVEVEVEDGGSSEATAAVAVVAPALQAFMLEDHRVGRVLQLSSSAANSRAEKEEESDTIGVAEINKSCAHGMAAEVEEEADDRTGMLEKTAAVEGVGAEKSSSGGGIPLPLDDSGGSSVTPPETYLAVTSPSSKGEAMAEAVAEAALACSRSPSSRWSYSPPQSLSPPPPASAAPLSPSVLPETSSQIDSSEPRIGHTEATSNGTPASTLLVGSDGEHDRNVSLSDGGHNKLVPLDDDDHQSVCDEDKKPVCERAIRQNLRSEGDGEEPIPERLSDDEERTTRGEFIMSEAKARHLPSGIMVEVGDWVVPDSPASLSPSLPPPPAPELRIDELVLQAEPAELGLPTGSTSSSKLSPSLPNDLPVRRAEPTESVLPTGSTSSLPLPNNELILEATPTEEESFPQTDLSSPLALTHRDEPILQAPPVEKEDALRIGSSPPSSLLPNDEAILQATPREIEPVLPVGLGSSTPSGGSKVHSSPEASGGDDAGAGNRASSGEKASAEADSGGVHVGSLVRTKSGKIGTVKFCGKVEFAKGKWLGVEVDGPGGKNDGTFRLRRYFQCRPGQGLFAPAANVTVLSEPSSRGAADAGSAAVTNTGNEGSSLSPDCSAGVHDNTGTPAQAEAATVAASATAAGDDRSPATAPPDIPTSSAALAADTSRHDPPRNPDPLGSRDISTGQPPMSHVLSEGGLPPTLSSPPLPPSSPPLGAHLSPRASLYSVDDRPPSREELAAFVLSKDIDVDAVLEAERREDLERMMAETGGVSAATGECEETVNVDKSQLYETEIFGLNSDNPKSDPSNILQLSFSPSMTHLALTGAVRDHCIMSSPSASSNVSNDDDHGDDVTDARAAAVVVAASGGSSAAERGAHAACSTVGPLHRLREERQRASMSLSSSRGVNEGDEKDGDGDHNALLNRRATEMIPRASESGGVSEEAASAAAGEIEGVLLMSPSTSNSPPRPGAVSRLPSSNGILGYASSAVAAAVNAAALVATGGGGSSGGGGGGGGGNDGDTSREEVVSTRSRVVTFDVPIGDKSGIGSTPSRSTELDDALPDRGVGASPAAVATEGDPVSAPVGHVEAVPETNASEEPSHGESGAFIVTSRSKRSRPPKARSERWTRWLAEERRAKEEKREAKAATTTAEAAATVSTGGGGSGSGVDGLLMSQKGGTHGGGVLSVPQGVPPMLSTSSSLPVRSILLGASAGTNATSDRKLVAQAPASAAPDPPPSTDVVGTAVATVPEYTTNEPLAGEALDGVAIDVSRASLTNVPKEVSGVQSVHSSAGSNANEEGVITMGSLLLTERAIAERNSRTTNIRGVAGAISTGAISSGAVAAAGAMSLPKREETTADENINVRCRNATHTCVAGAAATAVPEPTADTLTAGEASARAAGGVSRHSVTSIYREAGGVQSSRSSTGSNDEEEGAISTGAPLLTEGANAEYDSRTLSDRQGASPAGAAAPATGAMPERRRERMTAAEEDDIATSYAVENSTATAVTLTIRAIAEHDLRTSSEQGSPPLPGEVEADAVVTEELPVAHAVVSATLQPSAEGPISQEAEAVVFDFDDQGVVRLRRRPGIGCGHICAVLVVLAAVMVAVLCQGNVGLMGNGTGRDVCRGPGGGRPGGQDSFLQAFGRAANGMQEIVDEYVPEESRLMRFVVDGPVSLGVGVGDSVRDLAGRWRSYVLGTVGERRHPGSTTGSDHNGDSDRSDGDDDDPVAPPLTDAPESRRGRPHVPHGRLVDALMAGGEIRTLRKIQSPMKTWRKKGRSRIPRSSETLREDGLPRREGLKTVRESLFGTVVDVGSGEVVDAVAPFTAASAQENWLWERQASRRQVSTYLWMKYTTDSEGDVGRFWWVREAKPPSEEEVGLTQSEGDVERFQLEHDTEPLFEKEMEISRFEDDVEWVWWVPEFSSPSETGVWRLGRQGLEADAKSDIHREKESGSFGNSELPEVHRAVDSEITRAEEKSDEADRRSDTDVDVRSEPSAPPRQNEVERTLTGHTDQEELEQVHRGNQFLHGDGAVAPVTLVRRCLAKNRRPSSKGEVCIPMPLVLEHDSKNMVALREPGETVKSVWRSRKSAVTSAKKTLWRWFTSGIGFGSRDVHGPPKDCTHVHLSSTPAGELVLMVNQPWISNDTAGADYGVVLGLPHGQRQPGFKMTEQHAALLAPGGELCVFSRGGLVHWIAKGVNNWHSYEDERALRYEDS